MDKRKVLYFPYGGASSSTFKKWMPMFEKEIDFKVMDYPGHGKRIFEDYCTSICTLIDDLYEKLKVELRPEQPYYLAGHCMAAIVVYELSRKIVEKNEIKLPEMLIVSGHGAPNRIVREGLYQLTDNALIEQLRIEGGIDETLFDESCKEILTEVILPAIKVDSKMYDNYHFDEKNKQLNIEIAVLYGDKDWKTPKEIINCWDEFTTEKVTYIGFPDGHYFINSMTKDYIIKTSELIMRK